MNLPSEYTAYLADAESVIEGSRGSFPLCFVLWPLDEVEQANQDLDLATYAPGFLGFGGDGGGELLAFDAVGAVYTLPMVGLSSKDAIRISDSWSEFVSQITPDA